MCVRQERRPPIETDSLHRIGEMAGRISQLRMGCCHIGTLSGAAKVCGNGIIGGASEEVFREARLIESVS